MRTDQSTSRLETVERTSRDGVRARLRGASLHSHASRQATHRGGTFVPLLAALLPLVLFAAVLACTPQSAAPPASRSMQLPSAGGSAERITASLEDAPTGVRVSIEGSGFTPGTYQVALVVGPCDGRREVRARLFPLFAGDAGTVKGQALAQGLQLHDLVASHSLLVTAEASAQTVSCATIPPSD